MKTIVLALLGLGWFCSPLGAATLSTTDGTTYDNITTERPDPDGLFIEYTLPNGGVGMSKVKFSRLSPELQKQYGYDPKKARDYEIAVAKANEDYRQQCLRMEETARTQKAEQQARAEQAERAQNEHLLALAQLKAAEADLARATANSGAPEWSSLGGDIGAFAIPQVARPSRARTQYDSVVTPIPFPRINTPHYLGR